MIEAKNDLISIRFAIRETVIYMLAVRAGVGKPFQTLWTLKRLLPGMKPFVFGEVMFVLESLVTVCALIRTQICKKKKISINYLL